LAEQRVVQDVPLAGNDNDCGPSEDSSGKTKSKINDKACNSKDSSQ